LVLPSWIAKHGNVGDLGSRGSSGTAGSSLSCSTRSRAFAAPTPARGEGEEQDGKVARIGEPV
jgi:hypothetical protein